MLGWIVRVNSILVGLITTTGYLLSLYLLTYGYCYMRNVGCLQGWIARTIATAAFLLLVILLVLATRWLLRLSAEIEQDE